MQGRNQGDTMCWICGDIGGGHEAFYSGAYAASDVPVTGSGTGGAVWPLTPAELADRLLALTTPRNGPNIQFNGNSDTSPARQFTYQFETSKPSDAPAGANSPWQAFTWGTSNTAEKTVIREVLAEFARYINVEFTEVTGSADADLSLGRAAMPSGNGGFGSWQWSNGGDVYDGWVLWNSSRNLADPGQRYLVAHEIGHAMSLRHPGNYDINPANAPPPPYLPTAEDNNKFSVMSYNNNPATGQRATGLMLYDVAALQWRWGANLNTNAGNDVYTPPAAGKFTLVWDGGELDHIDAGKLSSAGRIDLRAGTFSSLGATDNFAICYGVTIENATGGSGADLIQGNDAANVLVGGGGSDKIAGGLGTDQLSGGLGDDTLWGGGGDDLLDGGEGNDTASYSDAASKVSLDLAFAGAQNTLGGGLDTLVSIERAIGSDYDDTLAGTDLANTLTGGDGNDKLDGRGGADVLLGGLGDDELIGGLGADSMTGGSGHDTYEIDDKGDKITEKANEGNDTVRSASSFALGTNFENLILTGLAAIDGTGNTAANTITGNDANNVLKGDKATADNVGGDKMYGGKGDDTYYVNNLTDSVIEVSGIGGGTDTVISTVSYALGGDVENLVLKSGTIDGTGNAAANTIIGSSGANIIDGGGGADRLNGGGGNDVLKVDAEDVEIIGGAGTDTVEMMSAVGLTLTLTGLGIERILGSATGGDNIFGFAQSDIKVSTQRLYVEGRGGDDEIWGASGIDTLLGGDGADYLYGHVGNDLLFGDAGADRLQGGAGNDSLTGGADADQFFYALFDTGWGRDTIKDWQDGIDRIVFDGGWFAGLDDFTDLKVKQVGTSTVIEYAVNGGPMSGITLLNTLSTSFGAADVVILPPEP
jgi:Ca2+-binding RTX toxin-like protein